MKPQPLQAFWKVLSLLIFAALLLPACTPASSPASSNDPNRFKGQVIRALVFEGYTDDPIVKDFEDKYGVKIESVKAYSNDDIFSSLKASGGSNFDIVTVTSDIWNKIIDQGLVQPVDTGKLTNYMSIPEKLRSLPTASKDGKVYGIPFSWGAEVVVYKTDKFPTPPDSFSVLFDEKNKGKIGGWDNVNSLAITALYLGYEKPFSTDAAQLAKVKDTLCKQFPLVRLYGAQISDYVNAFQSGDIDVALTGGTEVVAALKEKGVANIDFVIPKEGTLAWVDGLFMAKGAKNPELVQLLMDTMISEKSQAALFTAQGFGLANSKAYNLLPAEKVADLKRVDPDQNKDKRYEPWSAVDNYDLWTQTWNEVKAGCK